MPAAVIGHLPSLRDQADRLIGLGLLESSGRGAADLGALVGADERPGALLAIHPDRLPASSLTPRLTYRGKSGFVVVDMPDVDRFVAIQEVRQPDAAAYVVEDIDRGDQLANWSPDEALPSILAGGRSPLTLTEGLHWLLQQPNALERGHCFMTIGSRLRKANGALDTRTPAIWISNGTGRDGTARRNAPKVGWCWAGNRHTWLGFASTGGRSPLAVRRPQTRSL